MSAGWAKCKRCGEDVQWAIANEHGDTVALDGEPTPDGRWVLHGRLHSGLYRLRPALPGDPPARRRSDHGDRCWWEGSDPKGTGGKA